MHKVEDILKVHLDAVPNAVARAWVIFMINLKGIFRVTMPYKKGSTINP